MISREDAEKVANAVLWAAGSGFRHYTPQSKERIIKVTQEALDEFLSKIARVG
jgi:hypothetical protein